MIEGEGTSSKAGNSGAALIATDGICARAHIISTIFCNKSTTVRNCSHAPTVCPTHTRPHTRATVHVVSRTHFNLP